MDWASQDSRNSPPITSASERENRAVRQPPALAHFGESALAWAPTCCFSSDSGPISSGCLDSGEPRWTSQTVAKM